MDMYVDKFSNLSYDSSRLMDDYSIRFEVNIKKEANHATIYN